MYVCTYSSTAPYHRTLRSRSFVAALPPQSVQNSNLLDSQFNIHHSTNIRVCDKPKSDRNYVPQYGDSHVENITSSRGVEETVQTERGVCELVLSTWTIPPPIRSQSTSLPDRYRFVSELRITYRHVVTVSAM